MTRTSMNTNPYIGVRSTAAQPPLANIVQQRLHSDDKFVQARDPAEDIKGMPPNMGDGTLPHVVTFEGIISTVSRVYRASDEAIKHSFENARFMRNDPAIMECIEQRQRSVCLLDWHLEAEDEKDPQQKQLVEELTAIIEQTPRFMQYRENLMHAIWYGKYGVQHKYRWKKVRGQWRVTVEQWLPVNGDKIVFRYDDGTREHDPDQVGIRVGAGYTSNAGLDKPWAPDRIDKIEATDYGLAYFLEPWERDLLAIHKHMIEDGEYEAPENAGRVHGVGIRSRLYWLWFQKQETLAWAMEYLERSAFGIEIWYYPWGDANAESKTREAAQERIGNGRNIVLVPRPLGEEGMAYGVERIEPGMQGLEALKDLIIGYFGHLMKRYILGQVLTTEAESTGLGSNLASVHLDTYLQIVRYDATNLEETLTTDLVRPLQAYNFPHLSDLSVKLVIETEEADVEARLAGARQAYDMGCRLKESDVLDMVGMAPPEGDDVVLQSAESKQASMGAFGQDHQSAFGKEEANSLVQQQGGGKGMFKGFDVPTPKFDAEGEPISEDSERDKLKRYDEAEEVEIQENREAELQAETEPVNELAGRIQTAVDSQALKDAIDQTTRLAKYAAESVGPSDAQKEAGNYRKRHVRWNGLAISIENEKGSTRSGTDRNGKYWETTMPWDYGYIRRTEGKDGDHVDVFLGPDPDSDVVFVVDQVRPESGRFDEHKVMIGFHNEQEAKQAYLAAYEEGWKGLGKITPMTASGFRMWLSDGDTTKRAESQVSKFHLSEFRISEQFQRAYYHCDTIEESDRFWSCQEDGDLTDLQDGAVMKYTRRGGMISCEGGLSS